MITPQSRISVGSVVRVTGMGPISIGTVTGVIPCGCGLNLLTIRSKIETFEMHEADGVELACLAEALGQLDDELHT